MNGNHSLGEDPRLCTKDVSFVNKELSSDLCHFLLLHCGCPCDASGVCVTLSGEPEQSPSPLSCLPEGYFISASRKVRQGL